MLLAGGIGFALTRGGDTTLDVDEYADRFCDASDQINDPLDDIDALLAELGESALDDGDAEEARDDALDGIEQLADAVRGFRGDVARLVPDADSGAAFREAVLDALDDAAADIDGDRDEAAELAPDDIVDEPERLGAHLRAARSRVNEHVDVFGDDDFAEVVEPINECI